MATTRCAICVVFFPRGTRAGLVDCPFDFDDWQWRQLDQFPIYNPGRDTLRKYLLLLLWSSLLLALLYTHTQTQKCILAVQFVFHYSVTWYCQR